MPDPSLFSSAQVAVATFFGGPIGGTTLIALNEARLGAKRNAALAIVLGVALTAFLLWIALTIAQLPSVILPIAYTAGLQVFAKQRYGKRPLVHRSNWTVGGVTLGGLALSVGAVLAAAALWIASFDKVSVGEVDVIYKAGTTADEARAVAGFVQTLQGAAGATIVIEKRDARGQHRYVVGVVMADDAFDDNTVRLTLKSIGDALSTGVFHGAPVEMQMLDAGLEGRVVLPVSPAARQ
ncbi:MAG: hypothetical protein NT062_04285 [Proteobacteria bacterium]|nr:hypothetical protein [Pseudomonadota bacterium]